MVTADETMRVRVPLSELGGTGLRQYAGYVRDDPDGEMNGASLRRKLRTLTDTDPIAGAMLKAITLLLVQVDRAVLPAADTRRARGAAEFVETCLGDMSQSPEQTLFEVLTMLTYGWSVLEIVYKERHGLQPGDRADSRYDDGRIGWRKFTPRAQETLARWEFDEHGGLRAFVQQAPPDYREVRIPVERLLLFRPETTKNNPEGRSIFRSALLPAYFKRNIEQIEAIGIERDLAGLPKLGLPMRLMQTDASEADKNMLSQMVDLVKSIRRDENEGVIYPLVYDERGNELIKLELMNSGGQRQFDTSDIIVRYDQRIAMPALADFLLIRHEKVGSFALSSTKSDLFQAALRTWLMGIETVFNAYAIPRLLLANGILRDEYPRLTFGAIKHIDLAQMGETIKNLAAAGAVFFPSRTLEDALLDRLGLPIPPDDARPDPDAAVTNGPSEVAEGGVPAPKPPGLPPPQDGT